MACKALQCSGSETLKKKVQGQASDVLVATRENMPEDMPERFQRGRIEVATCIAPFFRLTVLVKGRIIFQGPAECFVAGQCSYKRENNLPALNDFAIEEVAMRVDNIDVNSHLFLASIYVEW